MGKKPRLSKEGLNRGAWKQEEDRILKDYIKTHGEGKWNSISKKAGLKRCGKSCRMRWLNYLRPGIKRGDITLEEEDLIIRLHNLLGNKWSLIAGRLPGRTDNEIKNYWNTVLRKKVVSIGTEVPELIRTIPIRLTKMLSAPGAETELNNTNTKGINPSTNRVASTNQSFTIDTQEESFWQFLLSMDCHELNTFQQSYNLQSDYTGLQFHASDNTVNCYAELEAMRGMEP